MIFGVIYDGAGQQHTRCHDNVKGMAAAFFFFGVQLFE
jgi:hypothetical protein